MSNVQQGKFFEKEVELILELKGYKVVRNNLINGTQIDLHASKDDDPLDNTAFVVECTDRDYAIGVDLVKQKSAILLTLHGAKMHYRLMYVSRLGFTAEAKAFAESQQSKILLLTLNDLENFLINLKPYVNSFISNYEKSVGIFKEANLFAQYIDLRARDNKEEEISSLDKYMRDWLLDKEHNLLFLLGDYGAGKTSFSRHFAYNLLKEKYVDHTANRYTPILINLRDCHRRSLELREVILDSFARNYGIELSSYTAFERFCSTGNVLLVLDGFDEMTDRSDLKSIINSFNQIYIFASLSSKILLTCRSNYFTSHLDIIELLEKFSISIHMPNKSQEIVIPLKDQGKIIHIEGLDETQIEEFVKKRFPNKSAEVLASIRKIHDLSDLSTRPVMLDMILSTLPDLEKEKRKINSAALYSHYTDRWTRRDQWRVTVPLKIRNIFCETLAWSMHCVNANAIPFSLLEQIMQASLKNAVENEIEMQTFSNDLQTCSFLVRIIENDEFRFAHKSFSEFFVAKKLINDLVGGLAIKPFDAIGFKSNNQGQEKRTFKRQQANVNSNKRNLGKNDSQTGDHLLESMSTGIPNNYANMFHFQNGLNEQIFSSIDFLSLQDIKFTRDRHFTFSNTSFRNALENEIKSIFHQEWNQTFNDEIKISEEIATFAIEYFVNMKYKFGDFIWTLKDSNSINIFCDIARLCKDVEWLHQEDDSLKKYIKQGLNENLRIVCATLLVRNPQKLSISFVKDAKQNLPAEGWSYFLFELAMNGDKYKEIFLALSQDDSVGLVDKVICLYGLNGQLPVHEIELIRELLKSESERESSLAKIICEFLPEKERIEILLKSIRESESSRSKYKLASLFKYFAQDTDWKIFRSLATTEKDPAIRDLLWDIEQHARTVESDKKNRANWSRVKDKHSIRDILWRSKR